MSMAAVALVCFGLFAFGIYLFRFAKDAKPEGSDAVRASEDANVPAFTATIPGANGQDREAELLDVSGGTAFGIATRGMEDNMFTLAVKASLPEIDREKFFYEGWLVRKVPYDFFSTGEMVTNALGEFVLEWVGESGKNYNDFTEVIMTLEARDGNRAPAQHILEGEFTE